MDETVKISEVPIHEEPRTIEALSEYDLYDLFRIRDSISILHDYGLADINLLAEVNRIIKTKV